jgi:hypothetical protein
VRRLFDVRAGEVELDGHVVEPLARFGVVVSAEAAHGDPQRQGQLAEAGQILGEKAVAPRIGEAD